MTQKIQLIFDECIGKPILQTLHGFLDFSKHAFEIAHVLDHYAQGTWDQEWVPRLAAGWIVVSGDRGTGSKRKGTPLPRICQASGITHVLYGPSLMHKSGWHKMQAIVTVWDQIATLPTVQPGSCYLLTATPAGHIHLRPKPAK